MRTGECLAISLTDSNTSRSFPDCEYDYFPLAVMTCARRFNHHAHFNSEFNSKTTKFVLFQCLESMFPFRNIDIYTAMAPVNYSSTYFLWATSNSFVLVQYSQHKPKTLRTTRTSPSSRALWKTSDAVVSKRNDGWSNVDFRAYSRTTHDGLLQKRIEEDLC